MGRLADMMANKQRRLMVDLSELRDFRGGELARMVLETPLECMGPFHQARDELPCFAGKGASIGPRGATGLGGAPLFLFAPPPVVKRASAPCAARRLAAAAARRAAAAQLIEAHVACSLAARCRSK